MQRAFLIAIVLTVAGGTVRAQVPQPYPGGAAPQPQPQQFGPYDQFWQYTNPNNFMPNIYNPQTQPLSPYLLGTNQLNNPAIGYYFGTRPGTLGMGQRGMASLPFMAMGGMRPSFFPQLVYGPEPFAQPGGKSPNSVLPPAGHPVVFNNTLGFYPSQGQAGGRSGLAGLGAQGQKK